MERAKKVHGEKYNYEKVKYKGRKEKVTITCREHGNFLQNPHKHLVGDGCPKCANKLNSMRCKYTTIKLKIHDHKKSKYCRKHGIKLIRIPYYLQPKIKEIFPSFIILKKVA